MATRRIIAFLLLVPITLFVLSDLLVDARGPYYLGANLDPDYCYLMNSLSLLVFHQPGLVEHPGTGAQELGAVAIFGKWLGSSLSGSWAPLQETVLAHPEDYLHAINFFLNILIGAAVFLAGWEMDRVSGSLPAALVLQLTVFSFRELLITLPRVDPEPVLVLTGFALMVPLIQVILAKEPGKAPGVMTAGAILGFGLATKILFLPWVAVTALFTGWKQRIRFLAASLLAIFVFLLPILTSLPGTLRWQGALITHSGPYGSGPSGLPTLAQVSMNFRSLFTGEPFLFYWMVYYFAVLVALRFGVSDPDHPLARSIRRLISTCLVAMAIQIVMVLKHFVAVRYLVPALVLTALLNGFLVVLLTSSVFRPRLKIPLALCGVMLLMSSWWISIPGLKDWAMALRQYQDEVSQLAETRRGFGDCTVIGYYAGSAGHYALALGSLYTRGVHGEVLSRLYPGSFAFHGDFMNFSSQSALAQVRSILNEGRCVLMEGWPNVQTFGTLPPDLTVEPLVIKARESISRLVPKGTASSCMNLPSCTELPSNAIPVEAEKFKSGTVVVDSSALGAGIGVIVSPKYPAYVEYAIPMTAGGRYDLWIRYAAAESRPLTLSINGKIVTLTACSEITTGWYPNDQRARRVAVIELNKGVNTLRLERTAGPFPAIDKFGFVKVGAAVSP